MQIEDLTADKAISMLRYENLWQRQENNLNPGDKPTRNKALKANSGQSKKQGKSQSKEKKARNPDKQGLHCGFYNDLSTSSPRDSRHLSRHH
jgi:hypothetical protein